MNIEFTRSFFCGAQSSTAEYCWCGFWSLRSHMTGCAAFTADGFGYLMEQFDFLHYLGMSIYKIRNSSVQPGAIGCCSLDHRLKMVALGGG